MDELITFINNTDSENEFYKIDKISNVSFFLCGSHVPHRTSHQQIETSSQNTHLPKIQLINGGEEKSGKNRILLAPASVSAAVSEDRTSRDKARSGKHTSTRKPVSALSRNYSWHSNSGECYTVVTGQQITHVHRQEVSKCLVGNLAR